MHVAALLPDGEDAHRLGGGQLDGFAGGEVECAAVEVALDGAAHDVAFGERHFAVRALVFEGIQLVVVADDYEFERPLVGLYLDGERQVVGEFVGGCDGDPTPAVAPSTASSSCSTRSSMVSSMSGTPKRRIMS